MGKSKAPAPPDPNKVAGAQTAQNIGTAISQQMMNNVNQRTPYGNLTYNQTGSYKFTDPNTGTTYDIPTFTARQTLDQNGRKVLRNQKATDLNLARIGKQQSARIGDMLSDNLDFKGLPRGGNANALAQFSGGLNYGADIDKGVRLDTSPIAKQGISTTFGSAGQIDRGDGIGQGVSFNGQIANAGAIDRGDGIGRGVAFNGQIADAGAVTRSYGDDQGYADQRQRVEQALMSRMNPQLDRDREALRTSLVNQGLTEGSEAFDRAMGRFGEQSNDARMQAILAGGQEQSRLAALDAQRASFENSAQAQAFGQNAARAQFGNDAASMRLNQQLATQQARNAAQSQAFGQNATRTQFGNDAASLRLDQQLATQQARNSAQQQAYGQALGRGQFANDAAMQATQRDIARQQAQNASMGQLFGQQLQKAGFQNDARGQQFGQQQAIFDARNVQRNQAINERQALRNAPLNEIAALMSGSQLQAPNFVSPNVAQIANVDRAGLEMQNYNQRYAGWQQQQQAQQQLMGGLFGLASGGLAGGYF